MAETSKNPTTLNVNPNTVIGSTLSQIVGITVTDTEVTLEFVYVHPRDKSKGQVVARVSLPKKVAEELSKLIPSTIEQHENDKKK